MLNNQITVVKLHRSEVIAKIKRFKCVKAKTLEIECDNVGSVLFPDVIELYCRITGTSQVNWTDRNNRVRSGRTILQNIKHIFRDLLALPLFIRKHQREIREVVSLHPPLHNTKLFDVSNISKLSVLYLRSDHWFGLVSGGSVGHVKGVIDGLNTLGINSHVVSSDILYGVSSTERFTLSRPNCTNFSNVPCAPEMVYNSQIIAAAREVLDFHRIDFIYQRMSFNNFAGAALRQIYKIPYVCEYNGSIPWMARHWDKRPIFLEKLAIAAENAALKCADLIVAVSDASRQELLARGFEENKILVNPNGVDPKIYRPDINVSQIKAKLNIEGKIALGFIGTFGKWHGADMLVDTFGLLLKKHPDLKGKVHLLMIGEGMTLGAAKAFAKEHRIEDAVTFTGRVAQSEGPSYLATCDILVSPHVRNPDGSTFFGSPTKLFEYMATGRAIISADLAQMGTLLQHEETAMLYEPGDKMALADAMLQLIENRDFRESLGEKAREVCIENYTWDIHTRRIVERLSELLLEQKS